MNDSEFESVIKLANEFEDGIAVKLQRYLWLKSWYLFYIYYIYVNSVNILNEHSCIPKRTILYCNLNLYFLF